MDWILLVDPFFPETVAVLFNEYPAIAGVDYTLSFFARNHTHSNYTLLLQVGSILVPNLLHATYFYYSISIAVSKFLMILLYMSVERFANVALNNVE